ncbi:substrate-binding domain-containing protein [Altererythrobacter sp.]|uniref:substrate-binding domain-containing protein n=1 Tax=Altererythrobacter sp. TaxID=1872480 RepID=UPI003D076731
MSETKRILIFSDNPGDDYVSRIHSGVSKVGSAERFEIKSVNIYRHRRSITEVMEETGCNGLIVTPPVSDDRHSILQIETRGIPYVRIAPLLDLDKGNRVTMDEFDAAAAITGLLVNNGHRRIGIMRGPNTHLVSMRRYNGYTHALGAKGLRVDNSLVVQGDFTRQSGREQARKLFAAKPTAIFASNDEMAAGIIDAANEAGISIPGTISLVGYDDVAVANTTRPRLTTVRQPLEEMGEAACRLLVDQIRNPSRPCQHTLVPFEIVERESVAEYVAEPDETPRLRSNSISI